MKYTGIKYTYSMANFVKKNIKRQIQNTFAKQKFKIMFKIGILEFCKYS